MIASNETFRVGLARAAGALFALDDAGVAVTDIDVLGAKPTITIDRAPPHVKPGLAVTATVGGVRSTAYVAEFHGCRVRWTSAPQYRKAGGAA